jgi:phosphoribosylformylglycinamidine synthase
MIAFTSDVTPRYVQANPFEGGKQAVAETYRNLSAVGAKPLATTDNLNFGNPEKPEIMGQFVGAIKGIGAAVEALDMPIVSGNVSLYNETDGQGILPTPTIGAIGLIGDDTQLIAGRPQDGDVLLLLGNEGTHLGQSALLAEAFGREEGDAPEVDLEQEARHGSFVRENGASLRAANDLSDGGLALAAFEMADAAGLGLTLDVSGTAALFGEDQARYLLAVAPDKVDDVVAKAQAASIPIHRVGTLGGVRITLGGASKPHAELSALYRSAFASAVA